MTHTHHRLGSVESLDCDYVVLAIAARDFNDAGAAPKQKAIFDIFRKNNPVNLGDVKQGSIHKDGLTAEKIQSRIQDTSVIHAVFTSLEQVKKVVGELKQADLGISVLVSGRFKDVQCMNQELGVKSHTISLSIGVWGRTDLLSDEKLIEVSAMCGHGMVGPRQVRKLAENIRAGRCTAHEAGRELARSCVCGVFNPYRAEILLGKLAQIEVSN